MPKLQLKQNSSEKAPGQKLAIKRQGILKGCRHSPLSLCNAEPPSQLHSTAAAQWLVIISQPAEDRRLSWPEWMITYQEGIPASS